MAGNPDNVMLWTEADVLVYTGTTLATADIPATIEDPFVTTTGKWAFLGLLVGDAGIEIQREWDETDIPAWGYGTILVASKDFKATVNVQTREDNAVMQSILWPGSSSSVLKVPDPTSQYIAFEKRTATGKKNRLISKRPSRLWVPNIKDVEGDSTPRELAARLFPNSDRELAYVQQSA